MYAVVDLETTGGRPETDRIIEIAIYLHDGNEITFEYSALVNPGVIIPPFIARLTGISDEMVAQAPSFSELAPRIAELLEGCVFVAHNVQFDYSFLRYSLEREGYIIDSKLFCTCKTSRKLIPGHPSYSLGRLCRSMFIELNNAHRAAADALATTKILDKLIAVTDGVLEPFYYTKEPKVNVSRIPDEQVEKLPSSPGVLYFLNENSEVIYLLKSKNIRKKAWSVIGKFKNSRYASIAALSTSIDHQVTGSQLMAAIKEGEDLVSMKPKYNRKFRIYESRYSIYETLDQNGFLILEVDVLDKSKQPVLTLNSVSEAKKVLNEITAKFELFSEIQLAKASTEFTETDINNYNLKVGQAVENLKGMRKNFLVTDSGPEPGTLSVIVIQNGLYSGYFLTEQGQSIDTVDSILDRVVQVEDHPLAFKSIVSYVSKGNYRDIIHF